MNKRGRKPGSRVQPKQGLTPTEQRMVERMTGENRVRWHALLLLNKWKPFK